ncbi:MAG: hypothetical protein WBD40_19985, partial [Tepidisphaeraceae bacterium]
MMFACAAVVRAAEPVKYDDPVPHAVLTEPYRVCQDLQELTARINNLHRKPLHKLFDDAGVMQPETVFFKDLVSGHEVMSLTRELANDIGHGDLGRPVWTVDGRRILFMGNRALIDHTGKLKETPWMGKNYLMNADYSDQRAMIVEIVDDAGQPPRRADGMPGKFNILDPVDPTLAYYADGEKLYQLTLSDDARHPSRAELIAALATPHRKIIQAISRDRKLLIQDLNADPDRATGKLPYMPEIHLINLAKGRGEAGYYSHHPFDYGLPEVKDEKGRVLHDAKNNYQFHSLMFGGTSNQIVWNYGPMTSVGEYLGWTLDVTKGLDGKPVHGKVGSDAGVNPFGQYESHGRRLADSTIGLYFSGPATVNGKKIGAYGLYSRDYSNPAQAPRFITDAAGGHVAGGEAFDAHFFAAHIGVPSAEWRRRVKESDAIVFGDIRTPGKASVLCYTHSDARGGTKQDRSSGKLVWSGMDNNDLRPYHSVPRPLLSRDATKVWFHSAMLMPTDQWTGIYVAVLRRPNPPTDLALGKGDGVRLTWKPAPLAVETKGFHVYRADTPAGPFVDLTPDAVPARVDGAIQASYEFADSSAPAGKSYIYAVTAEEWSTLESDVTSNALKVTVAASGSTASELPAQKDFDKTAPPAVEGFTVTKESDEPGQYRLKWTALPAADVRYYNVYFSATGKPEVSQKRRIASPLKSQTRYLDWSAPVQGRAFYAITGVDRQGNESPPAHAP